MKQNSPKKATSVIKTGGGYILTSARGEKISAIEGQYLSLRMKSTLEQSKNSSGNARRELIRQQLPKKSNLK